MKKCFAPCATVFLAGLLAGPCRAGEVADYLTKDGKLKDAVTLTRLVMTAASSSVFTF